MRRITFDTLVPWIVLGLFCATFALSFFVPIYTDELVIKLTRVRVLLDGFERISLFPQCRLVFSLPLPWTWAPSALFDWIIYGNAASPISIRITGMLGFLLWLGIVTWFAAQRFRARLNSIRVVAAMISLVSLGVMPFLMVLSRSEQPLLLGLTALSVLPYLVSRYKPKRNLGWLLAVTLYLLITSYMFSSHGKTFFFIPLMLVVAFHLSTAARKLWVGAVLGVGLVVITYESFAFYSVYYSCPDSPLLYATLNAHTLPIGELFHAPQDYLLTGLRHWAHVYQYVKNSLFETHYQADWLPSIQTGELGSFGALNDVLIGLIYFACMGFALFAMVKNLLVSVHARRLDQESTIPLALFLGMIGSSWVLEDKNFYESSLFLPLTIFLNVWILSGSSAPDLGSRASRYMFRFLLIAAMLSQLNLLLCFSRYIPYPWLSGGKVAGQDLSISAFNYAKTRMEIISAGAQCNIDVDATNRHLVVDDSTYFPFMNAYRPFHILYVANYFGRDIGDKNFISFLREKKSAGVIVNCDNLSPKIRALSTRSSHYCCIGQQLINLLPERSLPTGK